VVVVTEAAPYPELEPTYTATAIELGPKYRWAGGMLWNLDLTGNWLKLDRGSALYMLTAAQSRLMQSGKLGTRPVTR
jgi:hypothetical protein